jgi:hypothetical protein
MDAAAQATSQKKQLDIDGQAARLLQLPAAQTSLKQFVNGWLEVDGLRTKTKDNNVFNLTPALRDAMIQETEQTFLDAFNTGGDVAKLLTTKQTFVNGALSSFYGLSGGPGGDGFSKFDLQGSNRAAGVLGQGAFLTQHAQPENSSPVQRGRTIRERLLCGEIPPVPKDLNTNLGAASSFSNNRQRFEQHSKDAACVGCHQLFDPVGFAFENYDGFGRYRSMDGGSPVNATGTLKGVPEGDVPLDGPQSLIDYLSKSDKVRSCLVRYWSYYVHGRDNWTAKQCNDDTVRAEAGKNGYTLKSVLMGILHAQTFTKRVKDQ